MKLQILFGALAASTFLMGQNQEKPIDTIQILGRPKLKKERAEFRRHAQSTETLQSYELNRNNSAFIEQSLNTISGVQVDKRTNLGGQRIVIRGYGNDQKFNNWGVKFYLNSVPLTNADGTTVLEGIDFSLINNVEVIKGPAGTLYGSGVGGVARFYMRPETEKGITLSQKITGGSFGLLQSATRIDAVADNYSVMFNYGHIQSDGYRPRGSSLRNDYAFLGNFKLNSKQSMTVYASQNYSNEGVSGQISYDDYYAGIDPGNFAYAKKNAGNKFLTSRVSISHNLQILPNLSNMTSIFYSNLDAKRIAAGALENSQNPNYGFRSTFNLKNNMNENFKNGVEFGAEYIISRSLLSNYRFTGTNDNIPDQVSPFSKGSYFKNFNEGLNFFAVDRLTYAPWDLTLIAGISGNIAKYNREDLLALPGLLPDYKKDLSFNKEYKTVFTPHIALQKAYKNQIFNLSYSEGYNAPTSSSSFISGLNVANDDLKPERAKMWDFSVQGLIDRTKIDYQVSVFRLNIKDKLTQLSSVANGSAYNYFANTGAQRNQGLEASVGYVYDTGNGFLKNIRPFANWSYYDFKYTDFKTLVAGKLQNYDHKTVVGVPRNKFALGLDVETNIGLYLNNTFSYLGGVYTDFENTNLVKSFTQYNAKLGLRKSFGKFDFDVYAAGNNLTSQINYSFLFLGNSINDSDAGSNYPNQKTDVNPGPSKAYFFGGLNVKYRF